MDMIKGRRKKLKFAWEFSKDILLHLLAFLEFDEVKNFALVSKDIAKYVRIYQRRRYWFTDRDDDDINRLKVTSFNWKPKKRYEAVSFECEEMQDFVIPEGLDYVRINDAGRLHMDVSITLPPSLRKLELRSMPLHINAQWLTHLRINTYINRKLPELPNLTHFYFHIQQFYFEPLPLHEGLQVFESWLFKENTPIMYVPSTLRRLHTQTAVDAKLPEGIKEVICGAYRNAAPLPDSIETLTIWRECIPNYPKSLKYLTLKGRYEPQEDIPDKLEYLNDSFTKSLGHLSIRHLECFIVPETFPKDMEKFTCGALDVQALDVHEFHIPAGVRTFICEIFASFSADRTTTIYVPASVEYIEVSINRVHLIFVNEDEYDVREYKKENKLKIWKRLK